MVFSSTFSFAQEGTRNNEIPGKGTSGKVCIVPFEPKLYMSEIDQKINQQTKWEWETIRENFRHQLDNQLRSKLQNNLSVVSFYADSAKMAKDLAYTYKSTSLSYDPVSKPTDAKAPSKKTSGITNGQIIVEQNSDKKFMNTKLTNTEILNYLNKKYASEYFIFINELDIKNNMDSYDISSDTYQREVVVHYSILDKTGKTINAGIATSSFSSQENNPKKIVAQCFSPIATYIVAKFNAVANPNPIPSKN
ncbi:MAG: hypothetical protein H0X46_10445 [Bacteroidetes bacterium]|nr:hypothetical protein [Bacteroidota bacterium]